MINRLSNVLLNFIVRNTNIESDMYDVYKYGIEITLSSILNISLILVVSIILGDIVSGMMYLFCIIPIRSYCGGYHAPSYFRCNLYFVLTFLSVYFIARFLECFDHKSVIAFIEVILLISIVPILLFAPVKNQHKILTPDKTKKCRLISMILFLSYGIIALLLSIFEIWYGSLLTTTLLAVSVLVVIEITIKRRGKHGTEQN